jgi:predicted Zn-dependent protease
MRFVTRQLLALSSLVLCAFAPLDPQTLPAPTKAASETAQTLSVAERDYLSRDFAFVSSPEMEGYLGSIADKLLQTRETEIERPRIIVYSADGFNAMADANGALVLATETLRLLESEDELAALLGHELSHIALKHAVKKQFINAFPGELASVRTLMARQTNQNVSLLWVDLLAPNWNKAQEREADRVGFEMMQAAGYDPDAFATLFQKLHDAQLKRSERMDLLRQNLIKRAQEKKGLVPADSSSNPELTALLRETQNGLSEKVINSAFEDIAKMSKDYDSPEQRQELLTQYIEKSRKPGEAEQGIKPRSPLFAQTLRKGAGGALLDLDAAALRATSAMAAGNLEAAREALAAFVIKKAAARGASGKKGKKAGAAVSTSVAGGKQSQPAQSAAGGLDASGRPRLASAHLNSVFAEWFLAQQRPDLAEPYVAAWMQNAFAPAKAFHWRAQAQADKQDLKGAIATLEAGQMRLGTGFPFLPELVTYAKRAQDLPRAETFTNQCKQEDQKHRSALGKMSSMIHSGAPTGLHAECVARLGYVPKGASGSGFSLAPLKESLTKGSK